MVTQHTNEVVCHFQWLDNSCIFLQSMTKYINATHVL